MPNRSAKQTVAHTINMNVIYTLLVVDTPADLHNPARDAYAWLGAHRTPIPTKTIDPTKDTDIANKNVLNYLREFAFCRFHANCTSVSVHVQIILKCQSSLGRYYVPILLKLLDFKKLNIIAPWKSHTDPHSQCH